MTELVEFTEAERQMLVEQQRSLEEQLQQVGDWGCVITCSRPCLELGPTHATQNNAPHSSGQEASLTFTADTASTVMS
jgi:hypothetical protein